MKTNQFQSALRQRQARLQQVRHEAAKALGNYARDRVRSRIAPGASEPAGIAFPGYAATGHLRSHFQTFGATKTAAESRITMGLVRNAGKMARIKAFVHEYGMRIYARRAPFLTFKVQGKWVKAKSVYIRPKRYFETGWNAALQGAGAILNQYVRANWGK